MTYHFSLTDKQKEKLVGTFAEQREDKTIQELRFLRFSHGHSFCALCYTKKQVITPATEWHHIVERKFNQSGLRDLPQVTAPLCRECHHNLTNKDQSLLLQVNSLMYGEETVLALLVELQSDMIHYMEEAKEWTFQK